MPQQIYVIGGGAAGFFGAITAGRTFPNAQVTILEKNNTILNKVRISGGGRCNVTHACFDPRQLARYYPRGESFLLPLLKTFDAAATVRWFEKEGVFLKAESDGRIFPTTDSSETIIQCLQRAARQVGVKVLTRSGLQQLQPKNDGFWIRLVGEKKALHADRVLIAVGGYPQVHSYKWIPGVTDGIVVSPVPSLFTFQTPDSPLLSLSGISIADVTIRLVGLPHEQRGPILLTHWGFSGPAILRLSAWAARELAGCHYQFNIRINWVPALNETQLREQLLAFRQAHPKKQLTTQALVGLPLRFWATLCRQTELPEEMRWGDLPTKSLNRLINRLSNSVYSVSGKTTYKEEFVTCGGISLHSINPATLESTLYPGLFFAGEILDIDGITGGFNFQSAWTTGYVAGKHIGLY